MMKQKYGLFIALAFCMFNPALANAAEPEKLMESGNWAAYTLREGNNKVCYMVSKPVSEKGNYSSRGDVFVLVTHRPAENTKDVFSYIAGYSYKVGADVTVTIDGKKHNLFSQNDTAWAPDAEGDASLAAAIRSGSKMVVQGTSSRGTLTTDTFGLKGSSAAYKAISEACARP